LKVVINGFLGIYVNRRLREKLPRNAQLEIIRKVVFVEEVLAQLIGLEGIDAKIKMGAIPDNEAALDAFITELKKAWKQALKKSQKSKIRPSGGKSKIKSNSSPLEGEEAQRAGEGGVVKPTQEHPISNGSKPETVEDVIAQANKQQIEMLNAFKERIKTPEGRPIVEAIAKANGCQTPEDYIAKMEEALKNKGLL